ncbi:MAG: VOC family protein [Massiliimalia sp.]|jgi:catechol 2,3-dioxygenase-like lactoylglutathione lyase family enzyme
MLNSSSIRLRTVVVDCPDVKKTAEFYQKLLGWEFTVQEPDWILMRDPQGGTGLSFQQEEDYHPPVWPEQPGKPTKMLHLDFAVSDLEEAVQHALDCGAVLAPTQFLEGVRVFFDPAGHPFCLFSDPSVFAENP